MSYKKGMLKINKYIEKQIEILYIINILKEELIE